jgi:hypothetical protein
MKVKLKETTGSFELHPKGLATFTIDRVDPAEKSKIPGYTDSHTVYLSSDKTDKDGHPCKLRIWVSVAYSINTRNGKKSRMYEIAEAIYGAAPTLFDLEEEVGRQFQGLVDHFLKDGEPRDKIIAIMPAPGATPAAGIKHDPFQSGANG